jgi:membrane protein
MWEWIRRFWEGRRWRSLPGLALLIYRELGRTRVFNIAAAVAFFFFLALVPLLIVFWSLLSVLHLRSLFGQLLDLAALLFPPEAMSLVDRLLYGILAGHHGGLLSFGVLGYLWASSGGFLALIEALDVAYDVARPRPWWRERLQALLLTFTSGGLALVALVAAVVGPRIGHALTVVFPLPRNFDLLWPALRLGLISLAFLSSAILLYKLAPNSRHTLGSTIPGAVFAVVAGVGGCGGFSFYVSRFANYNAIYGSLGAVVVLMLWFYIIALAVLIGAELNAELAKSGKTESSEQAIEKAASAPVEKPVAQST